jgi:hypothetical protein
MWVAAAILLAAWTLPLAAQTAEAEPAVDAGRGKVTLSWDEFVKITGYDPAKKGTQVLTVPWAEVERLLDVKVEKVGQGATVDLPWQEFKALLEWSVRKKEAGGEAPPPTDFIISKSEISGTLTDDGAKFKLKVEINVLREKGWKRIPLLPGTVAITDTQLPADGVFLNSVGGLYELLTNKSGKIEATVAFDVAVEKAGGINQVGFARVDPGAVVLDLTIDRAGVDVEVQRAQSKLVTSADNKTKVGAALPAGMPVAISWERALPKVENVPTKLYSETRTLVAVADDMLLCDEMVNFNILHTAVRELKLTVPAGASVLTVTGPNIEDWRVDKGELSVVLKRETLGAYTLRVAYEAPVSDKAAVPVIRAKGVERERGFLGVIAVANVEIASGTVSGATAIDVRQLPADIVAMTNQPILLAFRYVASDVAIGLSIKKHGEIGVLVTIVDSGLFTGMQLPDGRRMTKAVYSVRNNRNQFLRMKMPAGAEIWSVSVSGNPASPAKDDAGNVLVPLVRSASGATELAAFPVELVYVETPEKTAPASGEITVSLPRLSVPVMQVMYDYYLPEEGSYESWSKPNFTGPMQVVKQFAQLSAGRGGEVIQRDVAADAQKLNEEFVRRGEAQAQAEGRSPIRVSLPINGKLYKLEKILALPNDDLGFTLKYSGWKTGN